MNDSAGKLILRLALGFTVLLHGVGKVTGGVDGIAGMVTTAGLPPWLAYGVYVGEVLAPLLVIVGYHARIGAALIAVNMLVAIALVHQAELLTVTPNGGWALELQGMYLFTAIALVLMGPGWYSVNGR